MSPHTKVFLAAAAGAFVYFVAEGFIASVVNPILTPLKLSVS